MVDRRLYSGRVTFRLGIDLGTSTTVAVLSGAAGPARTLLFDASPLLSSAVFAGPDADLRTGQDAERAATAHPDGLEPNPKRRIDEDTVWLGRREYPVVDILAAILARVAAEARRVAGEDPQSVVLTHPAAWGRARLNVLVQAADQAGLAIAGLVPEPVAAAAYFVTALQRNLAVGRCVVVYDLGAGTFDVSVVQRTQNGFDVVASDGLTDVGGLDLDAVIVAHARGLTGTATGVWGSLDWPQTLADRQARHALWSGARAAKEQLTRHATADLYVPLVDTAVHLTRDEFEKAAHPHLERTVALTVAVLRDAGVGPERIDGVFLVGGSSRIPLAATMLHRTLRITPTVVDQPELVVAEGCLHAPATSAGDPVLADAAVATAAPAAAPADQGLTQPTATPVVAPVAIAAPVAAAADPDLTQPTATPVTAPVDTRLTNWLRRVGAFLIDFVPPYALIGTAGGVLNQAVAAMVICIVLGVGWHAYNRWYLGGRGASVGKKALGLRLVREKTGQPIGVAVAFVRDLAHFTDWIPAYIGFLFPLWSSKRQTFADKIVGTVVGKV